MHIDVTPFLLSLREKFREAGYDIRFVGGCVRDTLRGLVPKDHDFCTDADPTQQMEVYMRAGLRFIPTGILHGTITVFDPVAAEGYEITSLRTESDHDGRHASVAYTSDWTADLARRDLTINAMAMDFDGNLYDPFGGQDDLAKGIVRFVGCTASRITEDYLRILRYFRFLGRFGRVRDADDHTLATIAVHTKGLRRISVERIWSEVSRILVGPSAVDVLGLMFQVGVAPVIGLRHGSMRRIDSRNPVTQLVASQREHASVLAKRWKMSATESMLADYLNDPVTPNLAFYQRELAFGVSRDMVIELARLHGDAVADLVDWAIPVFPLTGHDLIGRGFAPGPSLGKALQAAKSQWADSAFSIERETLLASLAP